MSSNAYALRPRLPRPISISVTVAMPFLVSCPTSIPGRAGESPRPWKAAGSAVSAPRCALRRTRSAHRCGSAPVVVGRLGGHLDVVRVALLEAGRGDPYEAALLLQLGDGRRADVAHGGARAPVGWGGTRGGGA